MCPCSLGNKHIEGVKRLQNLEELNYQNYRRLPAGSCTGIRKIVAMEGGWEEKHSLHRLTAQYVQACPR